MEKILKVHSVNDYARYIGAEELHPLVSVPTWLLCLLSATTLIPAILLVLSFINSWSWVKMVLPPSVWPAIFILLCSWSTIRLRSLPSLSSVSTMVQAIATECVGPSG